VEPSGTERNKTSSGKEVMLPVRQEALVRNPVPVSLAFCILPGGHKETVQISLSCSSYFTFCNFSFYITYLAKTYPTDIGCE